MNDDVGAVLDRLTDDRGGRVVDDQRNAQLVTDLRDLTDGEDLQFRVRQGLAEESTGAVIAELAEVLRVSRVGPADFDADLTQRVAEQVDGPAVEVGGGDNVIACLGNGQDRGGNRRLPGSNREARDGTLKLGQTLFEHGGGRVHDPGVDVTQLGQPEQVGRVVSVVELVGRGLVDRDSNRVAGRIGAETTAVQANGFGVLRLRGHGELSDQ